MAVVAPTFRTEFAGMNPADVGIVVVDCGAVMVDGWAVVDAVDVIVFVAGTVDCTVFVFVSVLTLVLGRVVVFVT